MAGLLVQLAVLAFHFQTVRTISSNPEQCGCHPSSREAFVESATKLAGSPLRLGDSRNRTFAPVT
jgi:hypothetical protein